MRIVLVEDHPLQISLTVAALNREFGAATQTEVISTEFEFRSRMARLASDPPDIFVIDAWLPWGDPHPEMMLPPAEILDDGHRAGFRCQKLLAESDATRGTPVILYGFLGPGQYQTEIVALPSNATYLMKMYDMAPLFKEIRRLTTARSGSESPIPER